MEQQIVPEIFSAHHDFGLNGILQKPELITAVPENLIARGENIAISDPMWQSLAGIRESVRKLIIDATDRYSQQQSNKESELYLLQTPVNRDNGVFFAFEDPQDPKLTTTVYLTEYPYEYGGESPPPGERIRCRQVKITSRREYQPNRFICSDFFMRVTPDFAVTEGDPHAEEILQSRGMYTNNRTFFFDTQIKSQTLYMESLDKNTGTKKVMPIIRGKESFMKALLHSDGLATASVHRILTGQLQPDDLEQLNTAVTQFEDVAFIDRNEIEKNQGKTLQAAVNEQATTTRTMITTPKYLDDLQKNLSTSRVRSIRQDVLPPEQIALTTYLAERAISSPLGNWKTSLA